MGRKRGSRSHDYDAKRAEMARRIYRCLVDGQGPSLNAMADYIGVSRPTLRHYFGDRQGAVRTALELAAKVSAMRFGPIAEIEVNSADGALREALEYYVAAWRDHGLGRLHRVGLEAGLGDAEIGLVYLEQALEPVLSAFETLIRRLQDASLLALGDPRALAFATVGPVHLAMLHQSALRGAESHPVDLRVLIDEVTARISGPRIRFRTPFDP